MNADWPVADLDPVRRMGVLAAGIPGSLFAVDVLDAPFDRVWAVAADLERELPKLVRDIRSMRIVRADGEVLVADAVGRLGLRDRFDVVLRPGWCVMQSTRVIGGMAAVADGAGTRFAFLGALRMPGVRLADPLLRRLARPVGRGMFRRLRDEVQQR
ncbi:MAG TPA: hypothetical protein VH352_17330 [Pseudonocardiaceae bacterium]|jgi:hypothetical protein|nr:hypothetical protein [Pseudonocardiaceae bacterium]